MAGVVGRRQIVVVVVRARGRVLCWGLSRQGSVPAGLFGGMVRVIEYDSRR